MNKSDTWNATLEIIRTHDLSKEIELELEALLAPKKGGGGTARELFTIDGNDYKYCRFTGTLSLLGDLVYQNDEKKAAKQDKGYSTIGISLWSKGQKHIKELKDKLTEQILSDEPDTGIIGEIKAELKDIAADNLGNDYTWLRQFLTEEQEEYLSENTQSPLDIEA